MLMAVFTANIAAGGCFAVYGMEENTIHNKTQGGETALPDENVKYKVATRENERLYDQGSITKTEYIRRKREIDKLYR